MSLEPRDTPLVKLNPWQGKHALIFADETPEIDIEGARMSAKTTIALDKELHYLREYPGIHSFMCRYSDNATKTKLRPRFEEICAIRGVRLFEDFEWDDKKQCYTFANGSRQFAFGLKSVSASLRYEKLRGLDVARVYNDQSEETPGDVGEELRASLRQKGFPRQITFSPNPPDTSFWICKPKYGGFPTDNSVPGRVYYGLSLYDNAYNLDAETIATMERTYPPDHAKHAQMILGQRGPNVIGSAVYADIFSRASHVRALSYDPDSLLLEGFDFGRHNPCYVAAQRMYSGGLAFLGGLLGEGLFLNEFIDAVKRFRSEWFEAMTPRSVRTCVPPPADGFGSLSNRYTSLSLLRQSGFMPIFRENASSPDVQLAIIDRLAAYMKQLGFDNKPLLAVNSDPKRWYQISRDGIEPRQFLAQAFEANYVWDDHVVSVSNNKFRRPKLDDRYANAMRCAENIELNFCVDQPTDEETQKRRQHNRDWSDDNHQSARSIASWMGF